MDGVLFGPLVCGSKVRDSTYSIEGRYQEGIGKERNCETMGILAEDGRVGGDSLFVQLPRPVQASCASRTESAVYDRVGHEATPVERGCVVVREQ